MRFTAPHPTGRLRAGLRQVIYCTSVGVAARTTTGASRAKPREVARQAGRPGARLAKGQPGLGRVRVRRRKAQAHGERARAAGLLPGALRRRPLLDLQALQHLDRVRAHAVMSQPGAQLQRPCTPTVQDQSLLAQWKQGRTVPCPALGGAVSARGQSPCEALPSREAARAPARHRCGPGQNQSRTAPCSAACQAGSAHRQTACRPR